MPDYQLNFPISVGDSGQLRQLIDTVSKVGGGANTTTKSLADLAGVLKALVPQSMAATAGIAGVGLAAAGAAEKLFSLARETGRLAEAQSNAAIRAGMTVREYGIMAAVADEAGVSTAAFTTSMRTLSKALSDNSQEGKLAKTALAELGVSARNQFGAVVPLKDFYIQLGQALDKVQDPAKKADLVIRTLGRGGLELLPVLNGELKDNFSALEKLSVGFDEKGAAAARRFDDALDRLSTRLKTLKREIGEAIIVGFFDSDERKKQRKQLITDLAGSEKERQEDPGIIARGGNALYGQQLELINRIRYGKGGIEPVTGSWLEAQISLANRTKIEGIMQSGAGDRLSGLRYQLSDAQGDLSAARETGNVKGATAALARVSALKQEIEALEKAKSSTERLSSVIERLNERALVPLAELILKTSAEIEKITRTGRPMTAAETADVNRAFRGAILRDARFRSGIPVATPDTDRFQYAFLPGVAQMEQPDMAYADTARQRVVAARISGIQGYSGYQAQIAQLTAGPGGEVAAIRQAAAIRIQAARDEYDVTKDRLKLSQDIISIERQGRIEILQLQRQQRDEYVNAVKGGFQALIAGGSSNFQAFLKSQAVGIGSTVVGNLAGMTYRSGMFSLPGTGTAENPTFLGKLLSGTPFGPKLGPEEKMMTAADTQLKAAQIFAGAVVGGGAGGYSLAGIMPGGGTLSDVAKLVGGPGGTSGFAGPVGGAVGRFFGGASSILSGGNLLKAITGGDYSIKTGAGSSTTASSMGLTSLSGRAGIIAGTAAGVAAGGMEIYNGIQQGGGRGATSAIAGALDIAAMIPGPQQPFVMAAAAGMHLATMLMGDPKQNRQRSIDKTLRGATFYDPVAINMSMGANGLYADYDRYGNVRGSSLSPVPDVLEPYSDWRRGVQVPGATGAQFGGNGPNTPPIQVNVQAMDSKSFADNADKIAEAVGLAISQGRAGTLPGALQNM